MNLSQQAWPLAVLTWWMLRVFHPYLSFTTFFFLSLLFCFSVWKFAFGQCLLPSVVLCQSPSAFVLLRQVRLGSYEVPLTGHWPWRVPPALCLSHYRTCEPLQLLLAQQLGLLHSFFTFICTNLSFS